MYKLIDWLVFLQLYRDRCKLNESVKLILHIVYRYTKKYMSKTINVPRESDLSRMMYFFLIPMAYLPGRNWSVTSILFVSFTNYNNIMVSSTSSGTLGLYVSNNPTGDQSSLTHCMTCTQRWLWRKWSLFLWCFMHYSAYKYVCRKP